jgi:hypothetical protein
MNLPFVYIDSYLYFEQAHSVNYIPTCISFSEPVARRSARFVETKTVKELLDTAQVQRL